MYNCTPGARWGMLLVTQLVEALRYKPESRGIDCRWCHWNPSFHTAAL
jgi:hypothetical protein